MGHYDGLLRRQGWQVMGYQTVAPAEGMDEDEAAGERLSDLYKLPRSAGGILVAHRGVYSYSVMYEPPNPGDPDLPDDKATVVVGASDHQQPPGTFRDQ
jgi:hypothetical protein